MKGKFRAAAALLAATAIIPIAVSKCSVKSNEGSLISGVSTSDAPQNPNAAQTDESEETNKLCALTAALYDESFCEETVKAIAVIMNTNYTANPESFSESDFLYEENADETVKAAYDTIESCAAEVKNITLRQNDAALYIPFSECSNGFTYESSAYPYLCAVSSVWDCFSDDYSPNEKCVGVSLAGLNYLCQNGETCESALKWYLPDFEITSQ